jgi:hypothetical protein
MNELPESRKPVAEPFWVWRYCGLSLLISILLCGLIVAGWYFIDGAEYMECLVGALEPGDCHFFMGED